VRERTRQPGSRPEGAAAIPCILTGGEDRELVPGTSEPTSVVATSGSVGPVVIVTGVRVMGLVLTARDDGAGGAG
jgi:hypothetical protein